MSLNELLRDSNSNKWANLNVQSVSAPVVTITTVNATTINSVQENTNREIIKDATNSDHVIDSSKDTTVARIVSKVASTGALQPYQIQSSNVLWKIANPTDNNEIILQGTQFGGGSIGTIRRGRHKCIYANISAAGVVQAQSGGITAIAHVAASGVYTFTFDAFTNIFYCTVTIAQGNKYIANAVPISNTQVTVNIYDAVTAGVPAVDSNFVIQVFGDAI